MKKNLLLSRREQEILTLIGAFREAQGISPTYRQLQQMLGLSSVGTIHAHIRSLKAKNVLTSEKKWRSLKSELPIVHPQIPIIGSIAKGQKIELFSKISLQPVPHTLVPLASTSYGFIIRDDSFFSEQMLLGDLLLVEARTIPKKGELLLLFSKEEGVHMIRATIEEPLANIQGVIVGLLRDLRPQPQREI